MADARVSDHWNLGDPYAFYVGCWSRRVAAEFLAWLALPAWLGWLDLGCGTGALTAAIVERSAAGAYSRSSRRRASSPSTRAPAGQGDAAAAGATRLPLADGAVDVVVSGLVINYIPERGQGLAEMKRTTTAHGTVAAYVWDYAKGMALMRHFWDAAVSLHPEAAVLDEAVRFPLCQPPALRAAFERAGLADAQVEAIDVATRFRDFDDYRAPFLGGQGRRRRS